MYDPSKIMASGNISEAYSLLSKIVGCLRYGLIVYSKRGSSIKKNLQNRKNF